MNEGLFLVLRKPLVFTQDILTINYEIDLLIDEVAEDNEVEEHDEVAYNSFIEREDIEGNEADDDDVCRSNDENISESTDNTEDSNNEVRNEDDSNDILLMDDDEEVPIERKHYSHFNVEDQRHYFSL